MPKRELLGQDTESNIDSVEAEADVRHGAHEEMESAEVEQGDKKRQEQEAKKKFEEYNRILNEVEEEFDDIQASVYHYFGKYDELFDSKWMRREVDRVNGEIRKLKSAKLWRTKKFKRAQELEDYKQSMKPNRIKYLDDIFQIAQDFTQRLNEEYSKQDLKTVYKDIGGDKAEEIRKRVEDLKEKILKWHQQTYEKCEGLKRRVSEILRPVEES